MLWVNACNYQGYVQLISLTFLLYPANNILNNFTRLSLFSCLIWKYAYLLVFLTCRTWETNEWHEIRPFKINCVAWVRIFCKLYIQGREVKKNTGSKNATWRWQWAHSATALVLSPLPSRLLCIIVISHVDGCGKV